jgi:nicotinate-nucleotide adenylyltransferase
MAPLDISASDIRARLARGADVSALVPARVLGYIRQHGLYR